MLIRPHIQSMCQQPPQAPVPHSPPAGSSQDVLLCGLQGAGGCM